VADFEHWLVRRWTAAAFAKAGLVLLAAGVLPALLHAWLAPADGSPLGLVLLLVVMVPAGFLLLGVAALKCLLAKLLQQD
jgi:hypothetical protein